MRVLPDEELDRAFAALSDPTRRAILSRLTSGEAGVLDIAEPFPMSQPAISKHLKVLEAAGLVSRRRLIKAPPQLVFRMYTEPEHLRRWWGPRHFDLVVCEVDLRVVGTYRLFDR